MLTYASGHGFYVRPYDVVEEVVDEDIRNLTRILSESVSSGSSSSSSRVSPTTIPSYPESRDMGSDDERLRIIDSNYANQRPDLIPINSLTSNLSDSNLSLQHSNMSNH
jgi:hypothetical protein